MANRGEILLLSPDPARQRSLEEVLSGLEFEVSSEEYGKLSRIDTADLVLVDSDDTDAAVGQVRLCREREPLVSVIALGTTKPEGSRLLALGSAGAYDCLQISDPEHLTRHVDRLEAAAARSVHRRESHAVGERILGDSDKIAQVRRYIRQASGSTANVLILGETGTGKELAARAIHDESERSGGPFLAVNCAAIPETLLESELFGHERGAFTGADRMRRGAFEVADGGTLFLDEIGDMPASFQAKLLRVLQPPPGAEPLTREFQRVGGERAQKADVRLVGATNVDLESAVEHGRFREDLLERLRVISIHLPPLRQRRRDIPILVEHFLETFCKREGRPRLDMDPAALQVLASYNYPGNVRELEAMLRSLATLKVSGNTVVLGDLPRKLFESAEESLSSPVVDASSLLSLSDIERAHIERVLMATRGNKSKASRILGVSRPTLDRKIERYGLRRRAGD